MKDIKIVVTARALITHDNAVLLVSDDKTKWYAPGGWLDGFEKLHQTCKREVYEELGIDIEVGDIVRVCHYKVLAENNAPYYININKVENYFLCKLNTMPNLDGENNLWVDEDNGLVKYAKWFDLDKMESHYQEYNIYPLWIRKCEWKVKHTAEVFISN